MAGDFKKESIVISDLHLWDENARFPDKYFNNEQKELINYFLSKPGFKIKSLIEEIVRDFDLPQLEKVVVWNEDNKYIVLEGNRRLTGYKLLVNPNLIKSIDEKLYEFILEKRKGITIFNSFQLDCLISEDKAECYRYIDRKHARGNNEVNWLEPERINYSQRRGIENQNSLIKMAVTNFVRTLDLPEEVINQILGKGYVTTFYRFIATTPAKDLFGLSTDSVGKLTYKDKDFPGKLKVIIHNVLKKTDFSGKKVDTRELNKNPEIKNYLKTVKVDDVKKVDDDLKKSTTEDIFGEKNISVVSGSKQKILPKSTNRKHLIPDSCRLSINEVKINNIYKELKDDLLLDDSKNAVPNAVGITFRVFIEITIDYFLEKEGVNLPDDIKLSGKITKCSEVLETKKLATKKQLINIRKVATDKNHLLCIQNFHDYVHSYKTQPSPTDLKLKWDNLQEFFQITWDYLYTKANSKKRK